MNWLTIIFQTIGGLGLFLYGMHKMSDGLKMIASDRIRTILSHLTKHRFIALLIGLGVTALIQSSSATTVLTVGFVNAGLLNIKQAVSVILGTNIGTTFTAWLIALIGKFQISTYALPAIGIGFYLRTFSSKKRFLEIGEIILGLGMLFLGLDLMKDAFAPIKDSQIIIDMFTNFSTNPILGVAVGTIFTMLLQSSSATIAIVQLLAFQGVISFDAAIPLILGDNIGTTITAWLASIGTSLNARRAARAHTIFNVLGVIIILPLVWIGLYGKFIEFIFPGEISSTNIMVHIAVAHSAFNIINALIFTVFINYLIKAACFLVRDSKKDSEMTPQLLEENLLASPALAMELVIKELTRMARLAKITVSTVQKGLFDENERLLQKAGKNEKALDEFQQAITQYLIRISEKHLATRESSEYPVLLHSVNDLEKIGDYSNNIIGYAHIKIKNRLTFNPEGVAQINEMFDKLYRMFDIIINSLKERDSETTPEAISIEDQIDDMKLQVRQNQIMRLKANIGKPESEIMIMDLATNLEKMGDHLVSIAKAVGKDLQWRKKMEQIEKEPVHSPW
jgi:phosphate:Na+ symporter